MASIYDKSSLVLIPSGTKTGKVFSQKPVSGDGDFTFTRASAATRVNADGNIEKETQNLLTQSNTFSSWSQYAGITLTSGQSGYDATNDAWKLEKDSSGPYLAITQSPNASGVVTFSFYAKQGTLRYLNFYDPVGSAQIWFDLQAGTISGAVGSRIATNIEAAGNGFYRCSVTWNAGGTTECRLHPTSSSGSYSTDAGYVYIQDAQLEQGLVARDYIETTTSAVYGGITDNVPRLDYTDSSCPALLLEPQRTNLINNSEYLNGVSTPINSTITPNQTTSPENVVNASIFEVTAAAQPRIESTVNISSTYSLSIFVKKKVGDYFGFGFYSGGVDNNYARFNISTGSSDDITYLGNALSNGAIEDFGNGWYRISAKLITDSNTGKSGAKFSAMSASSFSVGVVGDEFYLYGAQIEAGSYATSYIPTYGSSVTLSQDEAIPPSTSYDLSGSFSIFFSFGKTRKKAASGSTYFYWLNTNANDFMLYTNAGGNQGLNVYLPNQGGYVFGSSSNAAWNSNESKICVTYDATTGRLAYFINGSKYNEQTSVLSFTGDDVGSFIEGGATNLAEIKKYMFFTQALSDEEVIDLTTI